MNSLQSSISIVFSTSSWERVLCVSHFRFFLFSRLPAKNKKIRVSVINGGWLRFCVDGRRVGDCAHSESMCESILLHYFWPSGVFLFFLSLMTPFRMGAYGVRVYDHGVFYICFWRRHTEGESLRSLIDRFLTETPQYSLVIMILFLHIK